MLSASIGDKTPKEQKEGHPTHTDESREVVKEGVGGMVERTERRHFFRHKNKIK